MIGKLLLILSLAWSADNAPRGYSVEAEPMLATERPHEIEGVGIEEKLGQDLDLDLPFKDENGNDVTLRSYINGTRPVIISPIYYNCPGLCNFHLNGLTEGLQKVDWNPGEKFDVVVVSFDSKEGPELAKNKKINYMKMYNRPNSENGWHFLTASEEVVQKFTQSIGFKFKWNESSNEWSHASAAIVASPQGKISRYLPGILFEPQNIKLALTEAGEGKVGSIIDSLVLYCFQYNPHKSEYTLAAFKLMKVGAFLMVIVLALWLLPVWIRSFRADEPRS